MAQTLEVGDLIAREIDGKIEKAVVESVDGDTVTARVVDDVTIDDVDADPDSGMSERLLKSADEHRFTLAPWYIPDKYDSEDEWTDAAELQTSLWAYVRNGDRAIRLQHNKDVKAGEWVEALTLPFAWTVPMWNSAGQTRNITYPAGTVLLGVIWEPWAWDEVKQGRITGFSIGGSAQRVDESIGVPL